MEKKKSSPANLPENPASPGWEVKEDCFPYLSNPFRKTSDRWIPM